MFVAGTPSIARMTSPGHRLAADALLPGVIWMGVNKQGEHHRQVDNKKKEKQISIHSLQLVLIRVMGLL